MGANDTNPTCERCGSDLQFVNDDGEALWRCMSIRCGAEYDAGGVVEGVEPEAFSTLEEELAYKDKVALLTVKALADANWTQQEIAAVAYEMADAMWAERQRRIETRRNEDGSDGEEEA